MKHPILFSLLLFCGAGSLAAQSHLYTFEADYAGRWFGSAVAGAGDVDADGHDDVMTASQWHAIKDKSGDSVRVYSGRDGQLIHAVPLQSPGWASSVAPMGDLNRDGHADFAAAISSQKFVGVKVFSGKDQKALLTIPFVGFNGGGVLAPAGDVNRDGYADLLVGDPSYGMFPSGRLAVVSGKDGSLIHDVKAPNVNNWSFGSACAAAGDVDKDGHVDFLVGDPVYGSTPTFSGPGAAWLYSGKTGKILRTYFAPKIVVNASLGFGYSVASAGDIDRDGTPDVAIGCPGYPSAGQSPGAVFVFSGKTGILIRTFHGMKAGWGLGFSIASIGDWNGDAFPDLAIGAAGEDTFGLAAGAAVICSGKDSSVLTTIYGKKKTLAFSYTMSVAGDLDGDGSKDLIMGTYPPSFGPPLVTYFQVWSLAKKSLWTDRHEVSLKSQGKQTLQLDAGSQHAGSTYFLLGSMSGIGPGLQLGAHLLPLQVDSYFWMTASVPNSSFLQGSLGVLDSKGQAQASFTAVAGMPQALIGQRADHAYLVFGKGGFTMTSNWVPLLFSK